MDTKSLIEKLASNEELILASHVGKKTTDSGAVFGDQINNIATGEYSLAFGEQTEAAGKGSLAAGICSATESSASASFALGYTCKTKKNWTFASGYENTAQAPASSVFGWKNKSAEGTKYAVPGVTDNTATGQFIVGKYNDASDIEDALFVVGNGYNSNSSGEHRSNAFVVRSNGNAHVSGDITSGSSVAPHRGILVGTAEPTSSTGVDGDIYIMYE